MKTFQDGTILGKYTEDVVSISRAADARHAETRALYERIDEMKACVAELVGIYWGDGDGIEPPPQCIQRAMAALSEEVKS